jgi:hypothetical protein
MGEVSKVIGWILRFLFTPWGLVVLGVLIMNGAGILIALSQTEVPERAALSQVAGVLDRVVKVTRGRTHRVSYDLEIKRANGELVKLTLQEHEISEEQVKNLLGQPIVALFSGTSDVWELSTGTTMVIQYEQTREQHVEMQAFEAEAAPYLGGGGLAVSLIGVLWLFRRRRTAVAA